MLNGHTGNNALIDLVMREIRRERGVVVPWINIWPTGSLANKQAHGENASRSVRPRVRTRLARSTSISYPHLTRRDMANPPEPAKTMLGPAHHRPERAALRRGADRGGRVNMLDHCDATVGGDPSLANRGVRKGVRRLHHRQPSQSWWST